jgi:hypothetical protein
MKSRYIALVLILLATVPLTTHGQSPEDCPPIPAEIVASAVASCHGAESNTVCLGHPPVTTVVNCDSSPNFTAPGDTFPLTALCSLHSEAVGITLLKVRPLEQESDLTISVWGAVEVQNAATAVSQLQAEVITATAIRSGPTLQHEALDSLDVGEMITVIACNCTRHWLRMVLPDGRIGWVFAADVQVLGDAAALPTAQIDTPIYASMQAFNFQSAGCSSGILIQTPAESAAVPLKINGVEMQLAATAFLQARSAEQFTLDVWQGRVQVVMNGFSGMIPPGVRAILPSHQAETTLRFEKMSPSAPPFELLPAAVDHSAVFANPAPQIIGMESCNVLSDLGETTCRVHFANLDGDAIRQMEVQFVYAAQGDWVGALTLDPPVIEGDPSAGVLAWKTACSLGSENFIGPVIWAMTLTDAAGHVSLPVELSFNCVVG